VNGTAHFRFCRGQGILSLFGWRGGGIFCCVAVDIHAVGIGLAIVVIVVIVVGSTLCVALLKVVLVDAACCGGDGTMRLL